MMEKNNNEILVERLLRFSVKDSEETASKLIRELGDVRSLLETNEYVISESCSSARAAELIKLAAALNGRRVTDKFKLGKKYSIDELKTYICGLFLGATVEMAAAIFVKDGKFAGSEILSEGTINSSEILPRRICDFAIRKGADQVIVAHNHPRGEAKPSVQDKAVTVELAFSLNRAGITLLGAFVVAGFNISECLREDECEVY